jgi:hypothetical protein
MTHIQLLNRVVKIARGHGWLAYFTHDSRRSPPGFPDLTLTRAGEMIVAELKIGAAPVTEAQQAWLDALELVPGLETYVWRDDQMPLIEARLAA